MNRTERNELSRALKQRAAEEGFDAIGVAEAALPERDAAALGAWLGEDRHASMHWMARHADLRSDPRELLPGCRSVVALAMNYWPGEDRSVVPSPRAKVALYARGRDYHKVIGRKLRRLAGWLEQQSGLAARSFVDSGPVLERAWAERAGVGWIGKNANLLSRELGSWLLLGEILSCAELEIDAGPHADHCGSCTACIDACPTDAIVEPGRVDSNRCISYWTIEHRGAVPRDRRDQLHGWIFGCDVCQDVCPWNLSFRKPVQGDPFSFREDLRGLDPIEILGMDESTFRTRYSGTALMRAKWEGMRRNACLLLGSRASAEALPALILAVTDEDSSLRADAAWALGRIGGDAAEQALREAAATETEPAVCEEIRIALDSVHSSGPEIG